MARYINAETFEKYILDRYNTMEMVGINQVVNFITEQPTADVKEVVRGEWKYIDNETVECTNFNMTEFEFCEAYDFCPHCGADMREV